ncbi:glycosyltransferase family 4 protein [Candidatus Micrarchaeota archaeon]|nr:glycosyltransferase family 4 protein [Candidatus Micrarchaeota archaeon]MBU1930517.1 glycosyltransferase family 4 protein [Candidatus Micrarchaeota archaeon]
MVSSITLIGTLPPIKGVSDYCIQQTEQFTKTMNVEFYNFKSIYPEFLYPGKTKEKDTVFAVPQSPRLIVHETLSWYNPIGWIATGLKAKGEIVHFQWWTYFLFPVFFTIAVLAKWRGKKIVCTVHNVLGHESGFLDRFLSKLIFSIPHALIVHTQANKKQLQEFFGISSRKIRVIPHGIYTFYRDAEVSKKESRQKIGVPSNARALLFFGHLRPYKGVEDLIDAFISAKKKIPALFLIIAGKPWNSEYRKTIQEKLACQTDYKLVFDYIASSDIKNYFFASDVVVLPYKHFEAQSGPGNIALAFEKPLLVSATGGLPELVQNPQCIFKAGDIQELIRKLEWVFSKKSILNSMQQDSHTLTKRYSWPVLAEETIGLYNELINKPNQ